MSAGSGELKRTPTSADLAAVMPLVPASVAASELGGVEGKDDGVSFDCARTLQASSETAAAMVKREIMAVPYQI
jgi:uncharacterized membrane protein YjjB (DUF3815 family)